MDAEEESDEDSGIMSKGLKQHLSGLPGDVPNQEGYAGAQAGMQA